jgi:rhodanese-related sulfurtransferase
MPIRRVTPQEAAELLAAGWIYVDVRTIPEFEAEHPQGAYNVPLLHQGPDGRTSNPEFVAIMEGAFGRGAQVICGCAGGSRGKRAAEMLTEAGFANAIEMRGGFGNETDSLGRVVTPGWKASGLPSDSAAEPGHGYNELVVKAGGGAS